MTLEPIAYATLERPLLEKDRRGGLMVYGIISLLAGGAMGLWVALMGLGLMMTFMVGGGAGARTDLVAFAAVVGVYGGLATLFVWNGIDSIRRKRWVRPAVVAVGWPVILCGVAGIVAWVMGAVELADPPDRVEAAAIGGTVIGVFYVLAPGAYVWFYSTRHVRRTLEVYDPGPSWTERCPLPVFVLAANLVLLGVSVLPVALVRAVPFFGTYLRGIPAAAVVTWTGLLLILAGVLAYLGLRAGWWLALVTLAGGFTSAVVTFCMTGMLEFYRHGGLGEYELRQVARSEVLGGVTPIGFVVAALGVCVGYLLWVHRYFCGKGCGRR